MQADVNQLEGRRVSGHFVAAVLAANGIGCRQGTTEGIRGLLRLLDAPTFTGVGASGLAFFDDPASRSAPPRSAT